MINNNEKINHKLIIIGDTKNDNNNQCNNKKSSDVK